MSKKLLLMGEYNVNLNDILSVNYEAQPIYRSTGLPTHMIKQKHYKCLKYIDYIPDIIKNPDYIGVNKKEGSIEFVKKFKFGVLVAVKLDDDKGYLYVATVHDVQESKIERRLHSGRLKLYVNNELGDGDNLPDKEISENADNHIDS